MFPHARHVIGFACAVVVALAAGGATSYAANDEGPSAASLLRAPATSAHPGVGLARPPRVGSIEGVVTVPQRPARRVANTYNGGAPPPPPPPLQSIPAVVYIEGSLAGVPAATPRPTQIAQQDSTFVPAAVVVPVGGTVAFPNQDPFFHNVFSSSTTERFNLGRYPRGESKSVVFDQPGVVKVYCEVHKNMRSAVIVVQNPYNAIVGEDGRFRISNVPAGKHKLVIWHADHDPEEVEVTVPDNGVARVEVTLG